MKIKASPSGIPKCVDYVIPDDKSWGFHFRLGDYMKDKKEFYERRKWRKIFRKLKE